MQFERDRQRFVAARATLRTLLGRGLATKPDAIALDYTTEGKPFIADHAASVYFNVSHAHEHALYACSSSCTLGVDIENLNRDINYSGLAKRFFANREYAALQRIPETARRHAFFGYWMRKQAIVKAIGYAMTLPLDQFEVTVESDAEPRILIFAAATQRIPDWALYTAERLHCDRGDVSRQLAA